MSKFMILCPPEMASGFRLAGVAVKAFLPGQDLDQELASLRAQKMDGLVVVPDSLMKNLSSTQREQYLSGADPLVIPLPLALTVRENPKEEFENLVSRFLGIRMTLTPKMLNG